MTLPDLHPDELLRRASNERITPAERADLGAHVERCPACALELRVRADATAAGASSEADHAVAARILERVLVAKEPASGIGGGRWSGRVARAAVVALMLMSTAVGASVIAVRLHDRRAPSTAPDPQAAPPAVDVARPRRVRAPIPPATEPPAIDPAPPAEAPPIVRPPAAEHAARPRAPAPIAATPAVTNAAAPAVTNAALHPSPIGGFAPGADSAGAAVLLARAEAARAARRFADAAVLYKDLAARFPDSREEIVARVLQGQLLLDEMRDAPAALRWFERYLASEPTGSLAEEARLGRAQALQRTGARDEERAAWEDLLRRHPASVHAGAARARLAILLAP